MNIKRHLLFLYLVVSFLFVQTEFYPNGMILARVENPSYIQEENDVDFTFVWMSDTQYYSESYPYIFEKIVRWIVENKDAMKIEYVLHTGDIVDEADEQTQWEIANRNMKILDDFNVRYGVLAGNHDLIKKHGSYDHYYQYFGSERFQGRPYYGGSYNNNQGHYDVISVKGNNFLMVSMGWGISDEEIQWMNTIIKKYPKRKVILAFHDYLIASGKRSPIGEKLFQQVVLPNPNVLLVLSGHSHGYKFTSDRLDDDGDGQVDRTVYQILADYQARPKGGQGFMKLLHFNIEKKELVVKTYSPYLGKYEHDDLVLPFELKRKENKLKKFFFR